MPENRHTDTVDPLDLSGAAEVAALTVRRRITSLSERLAAEEDPAAIRDLAIGLAALSHSVDALDELAEREVVHKAFLARIRVNVKRLLEEVTGRRWDGDLEWTEDFPAMLVRRTPRGVDEKLPEELRPLAARQEFHGLRDVIRSIDDRLYGYEESDRA